jgi:hypothetical protein
MKPSMMNAAQFEQALDCYRQGRDDEEACTDLLTDAMHFMAFNYLNITSLLSRARRHFDAEAAVVTDESVGVEPNCRIIRNYAVYQLAFDEAIYGGDAGRFIVTSADLEREFSGPMKEQDARAYARLLNTLTTLREDCGMALAGDWDRSDEGFQAMQELIDTAIADAMGRSA